MSKQTEALKLALEALEESLGYVEEEAENAQRLYGQYPTRQARIQGLKDDARKHMDAITALREALAEQPAQQEPVAWCPDVCPITGLPFFMWIEHHETGQNVPTYGGPYDSYTIPVRDKDGSYCRERYDHDLGGWLTDEVEDVGIQIVSDQAYVSEDEPPASKQQEPVAKIHTWHRNGMQHAELLDWGAEIESLPDGEYELYTSPPHRKPLTDEQRQYVVQMWRGGNWTAGDIIDAVEAAHGITGEHK